MSVEVPVCRDEVRKSLRCNGLQFAQVRDEVPSPVQFQIATKFTNYAITRYAVKKKRSVQCLDEIRLWTKNIYSYGLSPSYLLSSGSLLPFLPSVTGTGLSARFTVCYRRPERGLPFTVKSGV